jgi:hypothetical protein
MLEQFGSGEALFPSLNHELSFLEHVHQFNTNQGGLRCFEGFNPPAWDA